MYIKVKVHADSKQNKLVKKSEDAYEVWVKAPAERGLANDAVREIISREINIEAKRLRLIKGATSPAKIFEY
ncbi:hypothetical protein AAIR98_001886 [Elusimicrobium simillimum]|uniref:DUF167 domain-containing protein n=1 Tax=Elusimicrobium simillimum TaxID=3143438 RepID=UPI003C6ED416